MGIFSRLFESPERARGRAFMNSLFDSGWDLQHPEKLYPNPFHPEPFTKEEVDAEWLIVEDLAKDAMCLIDREALQRVKARMWFQGKWLLWDLGEDEWMQDFDPATNVSAALSECRKSCALFEEKVRATGSAEDRAKLEQTDAAIMAAIRAARIV